ncbi:hypothetical protein [Nocardioides sp. SYSU DS0663]|uniref:hypothetical protein n=1 Tax=Nocardioides sp. SYSU DS0663 TaxID=3416445 RepID=UPI003F4B9EE9
MSSSGDVIGAFAAPWAFDAGARPVPTRFEITPEGLTQVVDHRGARYPVIADPAWFVPVAIVGSRIAVKVAVKALTKKGAQRAAVRAVKKIGKTPKKAGAPIKG